MKNLAILFFCFLSVIIYAQDIQTKSLPVYSVVDYGVKNDGTTMNTLKIQQLIDRVSDLGGGIVYFPPGKYLTGTFFLKSHINLQIESGATILGSLNLNDYVPLGEEKLNHSARQERHLINGIDLVGVAITGRGMINGRGYEFWPKDFRTMTEIEIRAALTDSDGFNKRPGTYVYLKNCTDVLVENVQFKDSPHHMIKVLESRDVKIQGISIEQGIYEDDGPNTDGLAVSGFNIRISDCNFTTGDDCIVIGDAEHLALSNCTFTTKESAIVVGGLKNGVISNCSILDAGCAINLRPGRGEMVENVTISNINYILKHSKGGNLVFARSNPIEVRESVSSWAKKWKVEVKPNTGPPPVIRNILISNVVASSDGAIFLDGLKDGYIEDITFDNIRYVMRGGLEKPESAEPSHPFYVFGHHTAPYGIFFRYVKGITLRDVQFSWNQPEKPEWGSPVRFENAENIEIDGFEGRQSLGSNKPVVRLKNVGGAYIHNCQAAKNAETFLEVAEGCKDILFMNSDMRNASEAIKIKGDIQKNTIVESGLIKK